ncbi:interaptin-like [Pseudochaenichthys georgianus]|uniref:interaptin-like n=1 Tax=Pseudochaenichthys georgianus TaxID=52239 RepID=UPI0039C03B5C
MEGTKSDQSNMETSNSQSDESLLQFDAETVKLLVTRGDELLDCVTIWEERYGALEEEMETKEAQHKQQLQENLVTINLLKRREEELLQSQDKSTKDLAEIQQSWESGKQGMKYVVDEKNHQAARNHTLETEKQKMELKLKQVMKHNTYQTCKIKAMEKEVQQLVDRLEKQGEKIPEEQQPMESKLKEVTQEKDDLAKKNLSCETELKQVEAKLKQMEEENEHLAKNNKSWETDVQQLKEQMREKEDKFSKDLAEEHLSCETELKQVEAKLKQVEEENEHLAKSNTSWETDVQQLKEQMREKEDKFSKDLAEEHLSCETELKQVEAKLKQLEEENEHLAKSNTSWETDVQQLKGNLVLKMLIGETVVEAKFEKAKESIHTLIEENKSWEIVVKQKDMRLQQLQNDLDEQEKKFSEDLAEKHQSCETKVHLMETKFQEEEKKMEDEKTLLEDLCLHMKNKSRGFFARRRATEERDVILQKMLRKMQEKEMSRKAKGEKEEKGEAGRQ